MSEPREERRAFDMAKRIREHGPDSLAGMPSEQIAGLLEEIASETRYLRKTRRAVIEKLEQARTDPDPDDPEGLVKAAFREGFAAGYESGMDDAHYHSPAGEGVEDAWAESDARDRLQAQEAGDGSE